jgi:hypothetical protein
MRAFIFFAATLLVASGLLAACGTSDANDRDEDGKAHGGFEIVPNNAGTHRS